MNPANEVSRSKPNGYPGDFIFSLDRNNPGLMESFILANYSAGNTERANEVFQVLKSSYPNYPGIPKIDEKLSK